MPRIHARLLPLLLLAVPAAGQGRRPGRPKPAAEKYAASEYTVKLVDYFLKEDTSRLKTELVPTFLQVLPETLPSRQREDCRAKQVELKLLKKIADSKLKPPIRRPGTEPTKTCAKQEGTKQLADSLRKMGFLQIDEDEESWLQEKTRCSECELTEEFSLTIIMVRPEKEGKPWVKYLFLHANDPLTALLAQYRKGKQNPGGTDFFGVGFFGACR